MKVNIYLNYTDKTTEFAVQELIYYMKRIDCKNDYYLCDKEDSDITLGIKKGLNEGLANGNLDERIEVNFNKLKGTIYGNNSRAVLLAVYRLLNEMGCCFLRPGKEYESIPELSLENINIKLEERPSFRHRGVCIEGADTLKNIIDFIDWLPKVGYNSFFIQFENPYSFLKRWYEHEFNPYLEKEPFSIEIAQRMSEEIDGELEKRKLLHWSYVNILDTKSQTFLCCTSS